MTPEQEPPIDARTQAALAELQEMLLRHYPDATFRVSRGQDDPDCIHLVMTVDVEDTDVVLDTVIDRVMELQIEEELPVHVIPIRPLERVLQEMPERRAEEAPSSGGAPLHP